MADVLLVFNAGSTSLKFAAYDVDARGAPASRVAGSVVGLQTAPVFSVEDGAGRSLARHDWLGGHPLVADDAIRFVTRWLQGHLAGDHIVAAGHRVMLGGARFDAPVRIDDDVLAALDALCAMEPSHQPFNVGGVRAVAAMVPGLAQIACFDSSFHRTLPDVARTYALPRDVRDAGVRRWGYHGLSFEFIAGRMRELQPAARRVIVAHLGGGSSLCALLDGRSVETTMGFGGLSGLPMATRCGDVAPEVLLYLLKSGQFDLASLERMLYERSGLLGLSGVSGDMRALQDSAESDAIHAVAQFVHALTKYVGAYAAVLGGLDALVFTGGIGEHSRQVRAALCRQLAGLGIVLDDHANRLGHAIISTAGSGVCVRVIGTDEQLVIARHTLALAGSAKDAR